MSTKHAYQAELRDLRV